MKEEIAVAKVNEVYMMLDAEPSLLYEVKEHFTFTIPNAKFHPKVKAKIWDGKISLLNLPGCTMYIGLLPMLKEFCEDRGYDLEIDESLLEKNDIDPEGAVEFVKSLDIHSNGQPLGLRDFQMAAIYACLRNKRRTIISPTSSGKSYIIYAITRYILAQEKRVLIIAPNIGLVNQMYSDFTDYSSHNGFDVDDNTSIIAEGSTKAVNSNIVISTWQSIYKLPAKWFNQFDGILVDEVHLAEATSLKSIMEKSTDVSYRIGLTGTLRKAKTHQLVIEGIFGKISKFTSTAELIERGFISNIKIKCLLLRYKDKEVCRVLRKNTYQNEIDYICDHDKRNKFIAQLALQSKGNTLILFNYVEKHGSIIHALLYDLLKGTDRKLFFIHGGVGGDEREQMRGIVEKENNAIIVASYGTLSTGTNIRRLHNIIAASPTKSLVRLLQSIGRGLRKAHDKDTFTWYDIADDFSGGTKQANHTMKHFIERLQIYSEEQFDYNIHKLDF